MLLCALPADFTGLEATLDSHGLFSAVAARIWVAVTDVAFLTFLHYLVSTYGLITDWPKKDKHARINKVMTKSSYLQAPMQTVNICLTHEAVVLLLLQDVADVFDAAGRELVVVFSHLVCGMRVHQVPAFSSAGAKVATVWALVMLHRGQNTRSEILLPSENIEHLKQTNWYKNQLKPFISMWSYWPSIQFSVIPGSCYIINCVL